MLKGMNENRYTVTKSELAEIMNVQPRTVTRWVGEQGCPHERVGGQLVFDLAQVVAWRRQRDAGDDEPDDRPAGDVASQGTLRKAELARKLTQARKNELELQAERSLKDLDLDTQVRAAESLEDLVAIGKEALALVASGRLSPTRGRAIQGLLGETRQAMTKQRDVASEGEPERIHLATPEGVALLEDFEWIVSDERRAGIRAYARREREADEEEFNTFDLAADLPADAEGDDPMPEEEVA